MSKSKMVFAFCAIVTVLVIAIDELPTFARGSHTGGHHGVGRKKSRGGRGAAKMGDKRDRKDDRRRSSTDFNSVNGPGPKFAAGDGHGRRGRDGRYADGGGGYGGGATDTVYRTGAGKPGAAVINNPRPAKASPDVQVENYNWKTGKKRAAPTQ